MIREKAYQYWVDGEVGRFEFTTHHLCDGEVVLYDTASEFFPERGRWEWYQTSGFKELAFMYGVSEDSYRRTNCVIDVCGCWKPAFAAIDGFAQIRCHTYFGFSSLKNGYSESVLG